MRKKERMKLAMGPASVMTMRCQRGWFWNSPGSAQWRSSPGQFAGHFDVSAERDEVDAVGVPPRWTSRRGASKADGECFDADAAELGGDEVAELMHEHHDAEDEGELREGGETGGGEERQGGTLNGAAWNQAAAVFCAMTCCGDGACGAVGGENLRR